MSNRYQHDGDNGYGYPRNRGYEDAETRFYPQGYPTQGGQRASQSQGYETHNYGSQGYQGQNYQAQQYGGSPTGRSLIAGRFDSQKLAVNLIIFALLSAVVTFAIVFVVDLLVGMIPGEISGGVPTALMTGALAGGIGVLSGLLYIPVVGTGNENLFGVVIIALAAVATLMWVVLGGLFDGQWGTLVTLAGIICTACIAYVTPSRIEAAQVRR